MTTHIRLFLRYKYLLVVYTTYLYTDTHTYLYIFSYVYKIEHTYLSMIQQYKHYTNVITHSLH